ncbi:copper homeostasis protein cutC homolog isoform X1 [Hydractinia symbiolongicarpus]|uniref:copper homeostasis protein cutC homolog isoform X1 n=1 Tax=Hydractinia symbiolongicarpus TaxID=13093 RepID=UPI00254AFDF9|nr:copper homeostasis protein cutC homolog isoform X1 [Hydractinia symbiolongicarpus]
MEICIDSVESAINAENAGASRVELCSNLMEGGTTPSLGVFQIVKKKTSIPVFVMIRPRGGDFLYSDTEFEVMKTNVKIFKQHNADGFVFGILTKDGEIDLTRNKELIDLCKPKPVTFHRAFDVVCDGDKALEDVISLGFTRILTSGMESTCLEGLPNLTHYVKKANGRITIVPGGGINERNVERILSGSGAKEFHCSARSSRQSDMVYRRNDIHMGAALYPAEYSLKASNTERIKFMLSLQKSI